MSENPYLIDLFDEDGNKTVFEHLDTVKYKDDEYVVCIPYDDEEDEVTEVVIFLIDEDEQGEEILSQVFEPVILRYMNSLKTATQTNLNLRDKKGGNAFFKFVLLLFTFLLLYYIIDVYETCLREVEFLNVTKYISK